MTMLIDEAKAAHLRGWALTPLRGKVPVLKDWPSRTFPTLGEVISWAECGNVGLRTGKASRILVVDVDTGKGGEMPGNLPPTVTVRTGGGGAHLYFKAPADPIGNSAGRLAPHVDVRGDGGQVVLPGSVHPETGAFYEWEAGRGPDDLEPAELPKWVLDKLRPSRRSPPSSPGPACSYSDGMRAYAKKAFEEETERVRTAPDGARNDMLCRAAFSLGQLVAGGELAEPETCAALTEAAHAAGLEEKEMRDTIASGLKAGADSPRQAPAATPTPPVTPGAGLPTFDVTHCRRTDSELGEFFAHLYADQVRWDSERGLALLWDGKRWRKDRVEETDLMTKHAARRLRKLVHSASWPDDEDGEKKKKAALGWSIGAESAKQRSAMLRLGGREKQIRTTSDLWDRERYLLGTPDGILDLRTGKVRPARHDDHITLCTRFPYDPSAHSELWESTIETIFGEDEELLHFMQVSAGYGATGEMREERLWILNGGGRNGKGTFVDPLLHALGDYATILPFDSFAQRKSSEIPVDLADLPGMRFVAASEPRRGTIWDEARLKQITGGDAIKARHMRKNFFMFQPSCKLWFQCNELPGANDRSTAFWQRVMVVMFLMSFGTDDPHTLPRDNTLKRRLKSKQEGPGILAWIVRGARMYYENGLSVPSSIKDATASYQVDSDPIAGFLADCCVLGDEQRVQAAPFYRAYQDYCDAMKIPKPERLTTGKFKAAAIGRGFAHTHSRDGNFYYGVGLTPQTRSLAPEADEHWQS